MGCVFLFPPAIRPVRATEGIETRDVRRPTCMMPPSRITDHASPTRLEISSSYAGRVVRCVLDGAPDDPASARVALGAALAEALTDAAAANRSSDDARRRWAGCWSGRRLFERTDRQNRAYCGDWPDRCWAARRLASRYAVAVQA